jgi:large subunit ribosomal protein L9
MEKCVGKMKVLLVQDVEKLGHAGDIKDVARGFGRNYLIPKGFAVMATPGQIRQAEERLQARRRRDEAARRDAEALASRINGQTLRFVVRAGKLDQLYGSVTNLDIANKIQEQLDIELDRRKIDLEDPIKRIGIYPVKVRLGEGLEPVLNVVVEGEGGEGSEAATEGESGEAPTEEAVVAAGAEEDDIDLPPDPEARTS